MVNTTFEGKPEWYGGPEGALKTSIERARDLAAAKFQPYKGPRVAPFSPQQQQSFNLAERYSQPAPQYGQAQGAITGALGQDIYGQQVQPYIEEGARAPGQEDIGQFLNPYRQEVLENIGRLGSRNLIENILPKVQSNFIGAGQYGSSQHQNLTNRAIRDTQEGISQAQANALHGGFGTALEAAQRQKGRQLEAGQLAGAGAEKQAFRQLQGAESLQNLAGAEQQQGLRGIAALNQVGGQQQQQEQNLLNVPYQEFKRELEFPYYQQAHLTSTISGLPSPGTSQFASDTNPVPPTAPQASPFSQLGGAAALYAGTANQRQGYSKGGIVKQLSHHRHYAEGGSLSPIQSGANAAIDTAELKSMRDYATNQSRPQVDPFWAAIARGGASVMANRQPGVLANLGQAAGEGLNEYHSQLANQDRRGLESAKIMEMIDNTKRLQEHRNQTQAFEKEKHLETIRHNKASEGLQASKNSREQAEFDASNGLIEGPGKMLYRLDKDEKGNQIAKPLEGMSFTPSQTKTGKQINEEKKANEDALQEWNSILSTAAQEKKLINEFEEINKKLDTKEIEAFLADYGITEPFANIMKSLRAGKTDIQTARSLSEAIAAHRIGKLKGKNATVAHQMTIKATKQQEKYPRETNTAIAERDLKKLDYDVGEAEFGTKMFNKYKDPATGNPTFSASQIKKAYKNWKENKGDKNLQTPEDYLEAMVHDEMYPAHEEESTKSNNENDFVSSLSEEQKQKRAAALKGLKK